MGIGCSSLIPNPGGGRMKGWGRAGVCGVWKGWRVSLNFAFEQLYSDS